MITRRDMLQMATAAGVVASLEELSGQPTHAPAGLQAAATHGQVIGVAVGRDQLGNSQLANLVTQNCGIITPSYEFKWGAVHPAPDRFDFSNSDWAMGWCQAHSLRVHGHNLCWGDANPAWLSDTLNRSNAVALLTSHIQTVAGRYRGKIDSWDVVNEPIRPSRRVTGGFNNNLWFNQCGPSYIDAAFHAAALADPAAVRVLNQDGLEHEDERGDATRAATLGLLKDLVGRHVPIQALGIESHLSAELPIASPGRSRFIDSVRSLGLEVFITELDINDTRIAGDDKERERTVARAYYEYLVDVVPRAQATRIIFWSPTDLNNWYDDKKWGLPRSDGGMHHPGLLDRNMMPAEAYHSVQSALVKISQTR